MLLSHFCTSSVIVVVAFLKEAEVAGIDCRSGGDGAIMPSLKRYRDRIRFDSIAPWTLHLVVPVVVEVVVVVVVVVDDDRSLTVVAKLDFRSNDSNSSKRSFDTNNSAPFGE